MSKYTVLEDFTDLKDKKKVYRRGDTYPKPANKKIEQRRLDELASTKNKLGIPLIQLVEGEQLIDDTPPQDPELTEEQE